LSTNLFILTASKLDLLPTNSGNDVDNTCNLFTTEKIDEVENPYIRLALEQAQKYKVTAVYFRRFEADNRPPVAQIYIYDFTGKPLDKTYIAEKHKELWNAGAVPVFYVFTQTDVIVFNCMQAPEFNKDSGEIKYTVFETIHDIANAETELDKINLFSARNFDNGTFLENKEIANNFELKNSAYEKLLGALKIIRERLINIDGLTKEIAHKLLVMSIFVKYLDERRDENNDSVFPKNFFDDYAEKENAKFTDVFEIKGAILKLFDDLSHPDKFNGEIFKWDDSDERKILENTDLSQIIIFLDKGLDTNGQLILFWQLYSFNYLPIELISNIYEEFLGKKAGVVYTPPFLVNLLIDECMPLDKPLDKLKIIDPSCGSSIFLVSAYKRLVFWWRILNNWQQAPIHILKDILIRNIYGVDKDPEAIRVSIFSLNLAMCDLLSPKQIREELKFESLLDKTFFAKDFFEMVVNNQLPNDFDLAIGNAPFGNFKSNKDLYSKWAIEIDNLAVKNKIRKSIPKYEISLLFAEQAIKLCKPSGLLCLIIPSGNFLYNTNSSYFRKYYLTNYQVPQILDFTHIARVLFKATTNQREGGSDVSTIALFAKNELPNDNNILHVTFRRTKPVKEKLYFELDKYDFHYISKKIALSDKKEDKLVWKANYLGGGRIHFLVKKLVQIKRNLGDFIDNKIKTSNWVFETGFLTGNKEEIKNLIIYEELIKKDCFNENYREIYNKLKNKYKRAKFLTNQRFIPLNSFKRYEIKENNIVELNEIYFEAPRNEKLFSPPHLLIKQVIENKKIPIVFRDDYLCFRKGIVGIHSPENEKNILLDIYRLLKNNISSFFIMATSSSFMIGRSTPFLKEDLIKIPFPENEKEFELAEIEQIIVDDVIDYMIDFRSAGENSKVLQAPIDKELDKFGNLYCEMMNTVYKTLKPFKPIKTKSFVCYPFYFGDKVPEIETEDFDKLEADLNAIIIKTREHANLRMIRVMQIYDKNVIYMIKPNQLRYWLQSIAIQDADETGAYFQRLGF